MPEHLQGCPLHLNKNTQSKNKNTQNSHFNSMKNAFKITLVCSCCKAQRQQQTCTIPPQSRQGLNLKLVYDHTNPGQVKRECTHPQRGMPPSGF